MSRRDDIILDLTKVDKTMDEIDKDDIEQEANVIREKIINGNTNNDAEVNENETNDDSEITNYESTEDEKPSSDTNSDNDENIIQNIKTKINGIDAEIVIKNENDEIKTEKEIQELVDKKHVSLSHKIKNKASLLRKEHDVKFTYDDYKPGASNFSNYNNLIFGFLLFPQYNIDYEAETHNLCSTNSLIRKLSLYHNYDTFNLPDETLLHTLPEIVLIIDDMNKLFKHEFMKIHGTERITVDDLDKNILNYLSTKKELPSMMFESRFINSFTNKLIMILNTNVEFAFRDNSVKADDEFLIAINNDITEMEKIQNPEGKQYAMWKVFVEALCSIRYKKSERMIYKHESYTKLNTMLKMIFETYQPEHEDNLLIHELMGNALKCYLPTIILSYFFVVRTVHFIARLINVYIQEKLYEGKDKIQQVKDIYEITAMSVITYENKYNLWKNIIKSPIKVHVEGDDDEAKKLTEKSQLYLYNHVITGGQYFLLKSIETAMPIIVNNLK